MKNLTSVVGRLAVVLTAALALGSCNRAEYATLPRSASYLGSTTVASVPRAAAPASAAPVAAAPAAQPAAATAAPVADVVVPATPAAAPVVAAAPAPKAAAPVAAAPAPAKLNFVQRLALAKVTKKLEKAAQKAGAVRSHDNTASTQRLDGKLRQGIVIGIVGLLVELLGAVVGSGFVYVIGAILIVIGIILVLLWLLDQA